MSEAAKGSIGIYSIVISEVFSPETAGMIALIETKNNWGWKAAGEGFIGELFVAM